MVITKIAFTFEIHMLCLLVFNTKLTKDTKNYKV
jgi:hypothetical protein